MKNKMKTNHLKISEKNPKTPKVSRANQKSDKSDVIHGQELSPRQSDVMTLEKVS